MFVFEYDHNNYKDLLQDLAGQLGVPVNNGKILFPRNVALGFMQLVDLQSRLQAMIFDYTFTDHYRGKRRKSQEEFYTVWFNEVTTASEAVIRIGDDPFHAGGTSFSTAMLTSSLFEAVMEANAGSRFYGINILLTNEWLADHLGVEASGELLRKYLSMKASRVTMEVMDTEYKKLIQEIMTLANSDDPFRQMAIQNRVMLLLERFFMRIAAKLEADPADLRLSREDITRVMEIEALLTKDVFKPAPFIPELAKMVHVSETKLKNDFKSVYGIPIYQYFQKARMQAAREVLQTKRFSIKQVAQEMGYSNLSNFTIAFKKEFGILPSQLS
jgi:AraC-like DNA-binding protein